jgi:ABC-type antimicrobial peptide transport system, ATPase component
MTKNPILIVEDLTKRFGSGEQEVSVLKGIDLTIAAGEMVALLGPSGSGKSTLLNILGTLMRATGGRHEMLGTDLFAASDAERTRFRSTRLGFVFQFHHLLSDLSALENVMMPAAAAAGRETHAMRERAKDLLDAVGLADRRDYRPAAPSGGQRQRVAVARALINQPALVLADEPTGNLDRESSDRVMELLLSLNGETQTSFLISTHDEYIAARCHRRLNILDGKMLEGRAER